MPRIDEAFQRGTFSIDKWNQGLGITEGGDTEAQEHVNTSRFKAILKEMADLHEKKAKDYGTGTDPLANVKASAAFGIPAWKGVLIRMNDKMIRLQSLCQKGYLANESAADSLRDLAVYSIIALILMEQEERNA